MAYSQKQYDQALEKARANPKIDLKQFLLSDLVNISFDDNFYTDEEIKICEIIIDGIRKGKIELTENDIKYLHVGSQTSLEERNKIIEEHYEIILEKIRLLTSDFKSELTWDQRDQAANYIKQHFMNYHESSMQILKYRFSKDGVELLLKDRENLID
jgi:hypothetical protein